MIVTPQSSHRKSLWGEGNANEYLSKELIPGYPPIRFSHERSELEGNRLLIRTVSSGENNQYWC